MKNLFNRKKDQKRNYVIFQDEAECEKTNYFYHGFLFVRNDSDIGEKILTKLIKSKKEEDRRKRDISFKIIENRAAKTPQGRKTRVVLKWLNTIRQNLLKNHVKFYCFGVNRSNLSNFWSKHSYNKSIYLKFFEIGLKSAIGWFGAEDSTKPINVTHLIYEKGPFNDEREDKVSWLDYEFSRDKFQNNRLPDQKRVLGLYSDEKKSNEEISNFLQVTDILLGVCKYSFIKDPGDGRQQCIDESFGDVIKDFTYEEKIYHTNHDFFKKLGISFFPKENNLSKEEFLNKNLEYFRKTKKSFYNYRETGDVKRGKEKQTQLDLKS